MKSQPAKKRKRRYETRWTVKLADRLATVSITVGGISTILAVSAVFIFLVAAVLPLFLPGSSHERATAKLDWADRDLVHLGFDEYRVMGWVFFRDGTLNVFRLDTGGLLSTHQVLDGESFTSWSFSTEGDDVAFGLADGKVRLGNIRFETDFPRSSELPEGFGPLETGQSVELDGAIVERTPEGQYRRQRLVFEIEEPIAVSDTGAPIVLLDYVNRDSGPMVLTLAADGALRLNTVQRFENLMTGEITSKVKSSELPTPPLGSGQTEREGGWPVFLQVSEAGTNVYLVWRDGKTLRYDTRDFAAPEIAERSSLLPDGQATLTELRMLLGGATMLAGDSHGNVGAVFLHRTETGRTTDGQRLSTAQRFHHDGAVSAIAPSPRGRTIAVGYGDGSIHVFQVTNGAKLLEVTVSAGESIETLSFTPKSDGLVAITKNGIWHWDIDLKHPEATLGALFRPVWYEGYDQPEHVWQSSSGTDDFEPKFGLWPLVFGTLKATFYSMLFGVPLALLAAIFTSEFLDRRLRTRIKTLIELMASLPSVVLGFLAALVFAPFVQRVVPTALVGFLTVPGTFLLGAYAWQLLPRQTSIALDRFRIVLLLGLLPIGMLLAVWLGPVAESAFFMGDIRLWLDGGKGSGFGGWLILLLPLSAIAVAILMSRTVTPWFRRLTASWSQSSVAGLDLARFIIGIFGTAAIAFITAWMLGQIGLDPRGSGGFLDTYVQRNALVVGFVMGFAIIPIIYTIAEDALSSVPEHLRAASLGAGATPWQTAIRIVIPTAMSGLFSAVMIGLGRAVGETMIVLMAAGNTPVLEMNLFNGFRTLSANIAVELPEAVQHSTHFRTLFLAALILFAMTFFVNTVAEIVRLRFRERAHQL